MMLSGAGTERRLKTFVVEFDGGGPPRGRGAGVEWDIRPTGLDGVSSVSRRGAGAGACELVLDQRAGRFCMAHTAAADGEAGDAVSLLARTTGLGRSWVCPAVLGRMAGAGGASAARGTIRLSREDAAGRAEADVRCDGTVTHVDGASVGAHLQIAGEVRDAYAQMCKSAERFRLGAVDTPDGPRFDTRPIDMAPSREIPSVPEFIDSVLDGSPPLLMSGAKIHVEGDQYCSPTVDLESGASMGIDVAPRLISVGLHHGSTASGVLRLLACLQLQHDHALTCEQVTAGVCGAWAHAPS